MTVNELSKAINSAESISSSEYRWLEFPAILCRLERKTHRQLKLPREVRLAGDLPEAAAAKGNARTVEQRRIESVESLAAELRLEPLADDHILEHREVPIRLARAAHIDRPAYIAERELRRRRERRRINVVVQTLVETSTCNRRNAGCVRTLTGIPKSRVEIRALRNLQREASLVNRNRIDHPTTDEIVHRANVLEKRFTPANGQLVCHCCRPSQRSLD